MSSKDSSRYLPWPVSDGFLLDFAKAIESAHRPAGSLDVHDLRKIGAAELFLHVSKPGRQGQIPIEPRTVKVSHEFIRSRISELSSAIDATEADLLRQARGKLDRAAFKSYASRLRVSMERQRARIGKAIRTIYTLGETLRWDKIKNGQFALDAAAVRSMVNPNETGRKKERRAKMSEIEPKSTQDPSDAAAIADVREMAQRRNDSPAHHAAVERVLGMHRTQAAAGKAHGVSADAVQRAMAGAREALREAGKSFLK